uniref:Uncharacterized protein n=1 Tax=Chlamydomonas euryale TaxID=1486919 RepID=A0A7R9YUS9_9CHLO
MGAAGGGGGHVAAGGDAAAVSRARFFLKQQRRYVRERQSMLQVAREEWRNSMAAVSSIEDPVARSRQALMLQQVKGSLDEQIRALNADAMQLADLKAALAAADGGAGHPHFHTYPHLAHGYGGYGLLGADDGSMVSTMPWLSPPRPHLALASRHAGFGGGGGGGYLDPSVIANEGSALGPLGPAFGFLSRWRDEQELSQALLSQHSSWLRSFREQIGRASGQMASDGA